MCTEPAYPNFQIAHIDKNNENNKEDNLALLCIPCHNLYDSTLSQGKNYTPKAIKKWRDKLYDDVQSGNLPPSLFQINQYGVIPQRFSDETLLTLRNFLNQISYLVSYLCEQGTYLSICIENNVLDFIENNFSHWTSSSLRCRNKEITPIQDEIASILNELAGSYAYWDAGGNVPSHIIPIGYYNDIGHAIKVSEADCCGPLFNTIGIRDAWILDKLRRLRELYYELDDMAAE